MRLNPGWHTCCAVRCDNRKINESTVHCSCTYPPNRIANVQSPDTSIISPLPRPKDVSCCAPLTDIFIYQRRASFAATTTQAMCNNKSSFVVTHLCLKLMNKIVNGIFIACLQRDVFLHFIVKHFWMSSTVNAKTSSTVHVPHTSLHYPLAACSWTSPTTIHLVIN